MSMDLAAFLDSVTESCDVNLITQLLSKPDAPQQLCTYASSIIQSSNAEAWKSIIDDLVDSDVKGCIPDPAYADHQRTLGNEAYKASKYRDAIKCYGQSLRFLDETHPQHAATAAKIYSNRALCFEQLESPQHALLDATCAIECDPTFIKSYYRRACAHRDLKNYTAALKDAEKLKQLQQQTNESTMSTDALITGLEKLLAKQKDASENKTSEDNNNTTKQQKEEPQWTSTHSVPWELQQNFADGDDATENLNTSETTTSACSLSDAAALAQSLSSRLTVQQTPTAGRSLTTTAEIPSGVDIYTEEPFLMMNMKSTRMSHCARCLKPFNTSEVKWYCQRCPLVSYCSPDCRESDPCHRAHGPECGLPWAVLLPADIVLGIRLARRLKEASGSEVPLIASLETGLERMGPEDVAHHALLACVAYEVWQRAVEMRPLRAAGGGTQINAGDLLTALCQVRLNGIAIAPIQRAGQEDRLALGIYPVSSLMNHACISNVSLRFTGSYLTVRSVEDLSSNTPVLHCYGPQVGEMTTEQRGVFLRRQYGFDCECASCRNPVESEAEMVGLKCLDSNCTGVLTVPGEILEGSIVSRYPLIQNTGRCTVCNTTITKPDWDAVVKELEAGNNHYNEGCRLLAEEKASEALTALLRCQQSRSALHPNNQLRGATANALSMAYHVNAKPALAVNNLRESLAIAERHYPPQSTNVAYQKLKLAMLLRSEGTESAKVEAEALTKSAMTVLVRNFGSQSELQDYAWI